MRDAIDTCAHCGKPLPKAEAFFCRFCGGVFHRECCDLASERFYLVGSRLVSTCVTCAAERVRTGQATVG